MWTHELPFLTHELPFLNHELPFLTHELPFLAHELPFLAGYNVYPFSSKCCYMKVLSGETHKLESSYATVNEHVETLNACFDVEL